MSKHHPSAYTHSYDYETRNIRLTWQTTYKNGNSGRAISHGHLQSQSDSIHPNSIYLGIKSGQPARHPTIGRPMEWICMRSPVIIVSHGLMGRADWGLLNWYVDIFIKYVFNGTCWTLFTPFTCWKVPENCDHMDSEVEIDDVPKIYRALSDRTSSRFSLVHERSLLCIPRVRDDFADTHLVDQFLPWSMGKTDSKSLSERPKHGRSTSLRMWLKL